MFDHRDWSLTMFPYDLNENQRKQKSRKSQFVYLRHLQNSHLKLLKLKGCYARHVPIQQIGKSITKPKIPLILWYESKTIQKKTRQPQVASTFQTRMKILVNLFHHIPKISWPPKAPQIVYLTMEKTTWNVLGPQFWDTLKYFTNLNWGKKTWIPNWLHLRQQKNNMFRNKLVCFSKLGFARPWFSEKVPKNLFSQIVVKKRVIFHGTLRKNHHQKQTSPSPAKLVLLFSEILLTLNPKFKL